MLHLLRSLHFFLAKWDIAITSQHISGAINHAADALPHNNMQASGCGASRLDLCQLEIKAAHLINLGISPSTAKVYDTGKKAYLKFCVRFNFTPIPAQ